jgi:hypothetical protein
MYILLYGCFSPCLVDPLGSAARQDENFRKGLLQGFSAANKQAKSPSCFVRKFAVLTAPLSVQNGELNPDGSVSRKPIRTSCSLTSFDR